MDYWTTGLTLTALQEVYTIVVQSSYIAIMCTCVLLQPKIKYARLPFLPDVVFPYTDW